MEPQINPENDWYFSHGSIVRCKDGRDICLFIPDLKLDVRIRLVKSYLKKDGTPWYDDYEVTGSDTLNSNVLLAQASYNHEDRQALSASTLNLDLFCIADTLEEAVTDVLYNSV
jgi:hypothetical protein